MMFVSPRSGFVQQVAPVDAKTYAPFCAFASLIIAQKASPVMAQLSKALCFKGELSAIYAFSHGARNTGKGNTTR